MDQFLETVVQERDPAKRKAAFDGVQELVGENQFSIYLVDRNLYLGMRNRVQGVAPSVLRPHATWNLQELWIQPGASGRVAAN
jgi:ABC-type transport system substrate-binding protein